MQTDPPRNPNVFGLAMVYGSYSGLLEDFPRWTLNVVTYITIMIYDMILRGRGQGRARAYAHCPTRL
jgi:hypothetical protein